MNSEYDETKFSENHLNQDKVRCTFCYSQKRIEDMEAVHQIMGYICSRECFVAAKARQSKERRALYKLFRG